MLTAVRPRFFGKLVDACLSYILRGDIMSEGVDGGPKQGYFRNVNCVWPTKFANPKLRTQRYP